VQSLQGFREEIDELCEVAGRQGQGADRGFVWAERQRAADRNAESDVRRGGAELPAASKAVKARNDDVYTPRAAENTLKQVMSRGVELEPFSGRSLKQSGKESGVLLSSAEGFGCADMARAAIEYKRRLARRFNALQAQDAMNDGVVMEVHGQMLSAVVQFHVPLPTEEKWQLSSPRNLRKAVEAFPFRAGAGGTAAAGGVSGQFCLF